MDFTAFYRLSRLRGPHLAAFVASIDYGFIKNAAWSRYACKIEPKSSAQWIKHLSIASEEIADKFTIQTNFVQISFARKPHMV